MKERTGWFISVTFPPCFEISWWWANTPTSLRACRVCGGQWSPRVFPAEKLLGNEKWLGWSMPRGKSSKIWGLARLSGCLWSRVRGCELTLITQHTEPSAPLSVRSDSLEKPGSKHLQKTSGKANEAAVTPKGFVAARNPQVPHQLLRWLGHAAATPEKNPRLNPVSSARVVFLFAAAV